MDKWLVHPTALKVLSVVVALLLWAVVHLDPESNSNINMTSSDITHVIDTVNIKTIGLDEKTRALRSIEPGTVKLVVSGSRARLAAAEPEDYVVSANLSEVPNGRSEVLLSVELPRGVELVQMTPNRAVVQIEPMQTKEFQVQVLTEGEPANGYKAGEPIVKPNNRVHVTLPQDELEKIGAVAVKVNVSGEEKTVSETRARVIVYDNDGKELGDAVVSPSVVEVEVPITKPYKTLPLQIGYSGTLPDGLSIAKVTPSAEQVTVYGPQAVLDKLEFYDGITVDLSKVTESGTFTYDINPAEGLAAVDPSKVSVTIEVEPTSSKLIQHIPITLNGLAEGMDAKLINPSDGKVDIAIHGAPSLLSGLQADDVQAVARLESLGVGRHEVPLDIHLPSYLHADGQSYKVTIDISDGKAEGAADAGSAGSGSDGTAASPGQDGVSADEVPADASGSGSESGEGTAADPSGQSGSGSSVEAGSQANGGTASASGSGSQESSGAPDDSASGNLESNTSD